ncbi:4-hydroxy-4-methyl-2-oxoglutarate aldolase [compost metagenome]|uniref:RraA family protein n=1 Tax=Pseudomonas TaxID=286 RepID=UPI000F9B837D|nr:RraA family protein [Pseudomonas fluorescens]VVO62675.1 4-hydroxy-4-methyl-2-oxoglutarate aldolase/4-carboxy-4-hydroxy-2-oxoadipate aldolase [Pseudomonas fluorescens]
MDESQLIEQLKAVSFPTLGHFLEEGFADPQLRAMVPNVKVVGRALTLKLVGADAIAVNRALAQIRPGDVLVIDTGGDHRHAPVGAVTSCAARFAGAVGIVVDGAVTDLLELREAGLPVFARGTSLLTTKLHGRGDSAINQPIHCAGVTVQPGDWVLADDNGVLFLDTASAAAVIDQALASDRSEPRLLERLQAGEPVTQVLRV